MKSLINTPLEQIAADWWGGIDDACKKAFFVALAVNVLAFGFEMTNLTLHHDDVPQLFIEDTILGHYLGRFGVGWLYYYTQNHYFMPFLQLAEGIVLMSVYGMVVARFWGARKAIDIALIAAIVCVFPYMAQTYQYNTSMVANPLAHLLAAAAVVFSTRATVKSVIIAAALFVAAFSIYQAVAANASDDLRDLAAGQASVWRRRIGLRFTADGSRDDCYFRGCGARRSCVSGMRIDDGHPLRLGTGGRDCFPPRRCDEILACSP